jgi:hypothetical protein
MDWQVCSFTRSRLQNYYYYYYYYMVPLFRMRFLLQDFFRVTSIMTGCRIVPGCIQPERQSFSSIPPQSPHSDAAI